MTLEEYLADKIWEIRTGATPAKAFSEIRKTLITLGIQDLEVPNGKEEVEKEEDQTLKTALVSEDPPANH